MPEPHPWQIAGSLACAILRNFDAGDGSADTRTVVRSWLGICAHIDCPEPALDGHPFCAVHLDEHEAKMRDLDDAIGETETIR